MKIPPQQTDVNSRRAWTYTSGLILIVHAALIFSTFDDYGMSWDQPSSHEYGEKVVNFYLTLGEDDSAQTHWLRAYGGLVEIGSGAVQGITGWDWFKARTLASALFGWIGVAAIMRAGWVLYSPATGTAAAIMLILTPSYYGHQFINPKDLPFAALSLLAVRYIAELAVQFPRLRWSTVIKTGLAIGLAMGVRVGGLQLYGTLGVSLLCALWLNRHQFRSFSRRQWGAWVAQAATILCLSWILMILTWPYAMSAPLKVPFEALKEFSKFWWDGNVFYDGRMLKSDQLPWTYIPNLLSLRFPEFVLLGLVGGVILLVRHRVTGPTFDRTRIAPTVAFAAAVILPIAAILILQARVYDGVRHILFIVPPLVMLAAVGVVAVARSLSPALRPWWAAILATSALMVAADLRSLHPYQYIFFNRSIGGGLATANRGYDLDYWATGLREAAEWMQTNYPTTDSESVIYSASAEPEQVEYFLAPSDSGIPRFRRAKPEEKARVFLMIRRHRQTKKPTWGRTLHTVVRQGVPLVDIVEAN